VIRPRGSTPMGSIGWHEMHIYPCLALFFLALPLCCSVRNNTHSLWRTQYSWRHLVSEIGPLPNTKPAGTLFLYLQVSRITRNTFLLFINYPVYYSNNNNNNKNTIVRQGTRQITNSYKNKFMVISYTYLEGYQVHGMCLRIMWEKRM
jgi:hypothetical protein